MIRDILGVWADPIACTDVLGFGPLNYEYDKLPAGVKHPKYVYMGVTAGIGAYGNNMGIPTVNGAIYFDESYTGNVVVYCGCIGLLPLKKYKKEAKPNHVILVAGGKTGRDGIHGVTFASAELTDKSEEISRPAVQIADPIEEEKLKRAFIEIRDRELGSATTDLGGGGLSSATRRNRQTLRLRRHRGTRQNPTEIRRASTLGNLRFRIPRTHAPNRSTRKPRKSLGNLRKRRSRSHSHRNTHQRKTPATTITRNEIVADLDMNFLFKPPESTKTATFENLKARRTSFPEPENLTEDTPESAFLAEHRQQRKRRCAPTTTKSKATPH